MIDLAAAAPGPAIARVLVVDDDVVILRTIKRYLKGYEVTAVETGEDALDAAARLAPDLVLLDFNLPGINGLEVMRELRQRGHRAPVLLMSGAFDSGAAAESLAYEADDYLAKPFLREALLRKLDKLRSEHQLARQVERQHAELVELHARRDFEAAAARALLDQLVARGQFDPRHVQREVVSADQFPGDVVCGAHTPDGRYRWMVADVTGHSLASALVTIPLASMFYAHARAGTPLPDLIETMDRELGELLPVTMFCTAIVCELDRRWGSLRVWNGGCPDVIVRSGAHVRHVASSDPPLATQRRTLRTHAIVELAVEPGDRILAFSDGLPEARSPAGALLGLPAITTTFAAAPPEHAFAHLRAALAAHTGGAAHDDDISLIEVRV